MITRTNDEEWLVQMHQKGELHCGGCDPLHEYPKRCKCGGLVHLTIVHEPDETSNRYKTCDGCGVDYKEFN